ncbi:MAG: YqaE/Pmp3 family membrane protein [Planctomycetota bacterium]
MADFIRIVFSILLPPLGVFFQVGLGLHFWLNIVLTLCGYIPGLVHAIYIIGRTPPTTVTVEHRRIIS